MWVVSTNKPYQRITKTILTKSPPIKLYKKSASITNYNPEYQNILTFTQQNSYNFSTANIDPMSMQPSTDSQENIHMTPNFTTAVINTITDESKKYKHLSQFNKPKENM